MDRYYLTLSQDRKSLWTQIIPKQRISDVFSHQNILIAYQLSAIGLNDALTVNCAIGRKTCILIRLILVTWNEVP